jgi:hypothetical protein
VKCELHRRHINQGWVEVEKEAEKEKKKEKLAVGREDRGRKRSKKYGLWTTQKVEEEINEFFGSPHGKEGRTSW